MSGRKLGGGRILGNGKGLAPPTAAAAAAASSSSPSPSTIAAIHRAASPYAPSDSSTVSFISPNSTRESISPSSSAPLPHIPQDLVSNVSLPGPSNGGAQSVGANDNRLVCPICQEEMVTLLQLNRHIDDVHQELPEETQDEVKSWFDKQVRKAKKFQPLNIINQTLRGLDVFESNETQPVLATSAIATAPGRPAEKAVDPEELVTRHHWQRPTGNDPCTDPTCTRKLGPFSGLVNCRKCGRLFCEEHTMYQMKLSRSANHEPVRGIWCRVCETCFKSREGYNDHWGTVRDHMAEFKAIRAKRVDRHKLEVQRLEKRLTKLTRLLAEMPPEEGSGLLALTGQKSQRKMIEQSVVSWEEDGAVTNCPFCKQEFGSWTFRRHHCRICGKVVCADPETACSTEVGLDVAHPTINTEKPPRIVTTTLDIRMCRDCKSTIFSHRDFAASIAHKPPDQRAYETLRQFERGIRMLMPSFQKALLALQPPNEDDYRQDKPPPTSAQVQEAAKIRKRLTDAFAKYDLAARRLRDMKTDSPTQLRLQQSVYAAASAFLHANLIPLKSVPRVLRSNSMQHQHRRLLNGSTSTLSPLRNGESAFSKDAETSSNAGASEASVVQSELDLEEKEAKERLVVLEEQMFMVQEMLKSARAQRRFEEVSALNRNVEELEAEIERAKEGVRGVEERMGALYIGG
ncbi:vacuolar segregation protein pep7 [Neurospora crassa OR74A]|uniref:Vacuolar segregation protein pep7 n=1 Tax=Neurospora crassa (strain ATCC 24698 / 74-OR23-1A / CBS 708.71 / DSM 1257 / FGSC 987) TaxID=367110 RepID=Q7SBH2_NEUCR|nr:vacuolar segregation protein pep7 [Neurospora crassa OR74A]EAA33728.2 vacuolar segregation protein pep7 [Neurospora crassa OR74A]|eukprot:XP_962964.2 vacuolar segregation protein pep7 [Neurospora crassa OR74A]